MNFSSRVMQTDDWRSLSFFKREEFDAPNKMGFEFMTWLDNVRRLAGVAFAISSSYRTVTHNAEVGGASDSSHCDIPCNTVDISPLHVPTDPNGNRARFEIIKAALSLGCVRIGIYADGSVHLDRSTTLPSPRLWHKVRGS